MNPNVQRIAQVLTQMGFETVSNSTIIPRLNRIRPNGETALRDSIATGINLILKLNTFLDEMNSSGIWNFVHIVITDGVDTVSQTPLEQLAFLFSLIGRTIPRERCMTVFIGIDLTAQALAQLAVLKALGGDNCQIYNATNVNLSQIFQNISVSIGVQRQVSMEVASMGGVTAMRMQQNNVPVLSIVRRKFAVLLNLDLSGSMDGARYNALKNSTANFLARLEGNDLASCIVFNSRVQLLNSIPLNKPKEYDDSGVQVIRCNNQ